MKFKTGDLVLVRHPMLRTGPSILVPSIIIDVMPYANSSFLKATVYNIPGRRIDTAYNTHLKLLVPYSNPKVGESGK